MRSNKATPEASSDIPDILQFHLSGVVIEIPSSVVGPSVGAALADGKYEHKEAAALKKLIKDDDVYFEVGAGVGFLSALAYQTIRKPNSIFAYEANPELIPVIKRTWELNGVDGRVHNVILGEGDGTATFNVSKEFWASSATVASNRSRQVEIPRKDFGAALNEARPSVLVMDIEGGERDLLLGRTLPLFIRKIVIELHPVFIGPRVCSEIVKGLLNQGFTISFDQVKGPMFAFWR